MKKNVPKLRLKGCQGEWESSTFNDVIESFNYGLNVAATQFDGENIYLRITDIDDETRSLSTKQLSSPQIILNKSDEYLLKDGDITVARTGASVGKSYIYHDSDGKIYFAGYLIRMRVKTMYDSDFVFLNTLSRHFVDYIKIVSQRSGQPGVNSKELGLYSFLISPTLHEQRQIAAYFRSLDGILSGCEARLSSLRRLKEGALQAFFPQQGETGPKIRFKGCKGEWERLPLSSIATRVSDTETSQSLPYVEFEDIVSGEGILNKDIKDKKGIKTGNKFVAGDVLFGKLRPYLKNILLANFTGIAVGDFWVLRPNGILPEILYLLVSSNAFMEVANISSGSKMPRSDWNLVSNSQFNIPPLPEQHLIAVFFRALDHRIDLERQRLEKLKQLKAACLEKMFV